MSEKHNSKEDQSENTHSLSEAQDSSHSQNDSPSSPSLDRRSFAKTAGLAAAATVVGATSVSASEVKNSIFNKINKEVADTKKTAATYTKMGGTYNKLLPRL